MNSNSDNSLAVSGMCSPPIKAIGVFSSPTYASVSAGKWYWIQYERTRYYITNGERKDSFTDAQTELQKCLAVSGNDLGLFQTKLIGNTWIEFKRCIPYVGKMKKEFIFWGQEVPDI